VAKLQERLEQAIEVSPYGTKTAFHVRFATLAEERDLAGRSNPVFYRHLSGMGRPPNVDWLRVFADTAGVRWEWLATGVGGITQAHELERRSAATSADMRVLDAIRARFGDAAAAPGLAIWIGGVRAFTDYIIAGASDGADVTPEQRGQVRDAVLHWLNTPVRRLPIRGRQLPVELVNAFMSSMCSWAVLFLSYGSHGETLEEVTLQLRGESEEVP